MIPLVELKNVTKRFKMGKREQIAVNQISLSIFRGETLGLVGESSCGKSTVGKLILRLLEPSSGEILYNNKSLSTYSKKEIQSLRQQMQIVFQDPYASLNPRMTVQDIIGEPLDIHRIAKGEAKKQRIQALLNLVGLNPSHMSRFPHEFSGGQRQRIGIARALAVNPEFLICDEPLSALDVSIQAQVINLLKDLQKRMGLTYLFIAHDLAVVKYLSDRVAVMYMGNLMELATAEELYQNPQHPYTKLLLSSIFTPEPDVESKRTRIIMPEGMPDPLSPPSGCIFRTRCPFASKICQEKTPSLAQISPTHFTNCHFTTSTERISIGLEGTS
ncbi:MAG: ATP-binding cassette domain-containing protein [Chlamydiia bacterium]|nr:ATP-binding cassette domain-containing protein [Chlamydiia bacterium]